MIPAPFSYHRPKTVSEAATLLAQYGDDSRLLAGGQSLIPMMKLRLATPEHVIDLAGVGELKTIERTDNTLIIGAMTTQAELAASNVMADALPIVREACLLIADPQVRYVGTLGGNVANGDPGNDMPAVMMCLNAVFRLRSQGGTRSINAREFYQGTYITALKPDEILTAIEIPLPPEGHGYAYEKLKRKIGDYATAAAGVVLTARDGRITTCAITLTNLADKPLFAKDAAAAVVGSALDRAALEAAARAGRTIMSPASDARGTTEYRTFVGGVMVERALKRAFARANG
jgi:carbon-monoxide dehydrogenase medium subunit